MQFNSVFLAMELEQQGGRIIWVWTITEKNMARHAGLDVDKTGPNHRMSFGRCIDERHHIPHQRVKSS